MAEVNLQIATRNYVVTCQDGEEEHLTTLAGMVDGKAAEAGNAAGLNESRMLLFASLLLADELHGSRHMLNAGDQQDIGNQADGGASEPSGQTDMSAAQNKADDIDPAQESALRALEKLADRIEEFANGLELKSRPA